MGFVPFGLTQILVLGFDIIKIYFVSFSVYCPFTNVFNFFTDKSPAITILHHKSERPTDVKGFNKPGSFIQNIIYNAEMEQIVQLVNRSYSCRQNLKYECYKARLLNSPCKFLIFHYFTETFCW